MKEINFTPGEYAEAQAKKEAHDRAREQARFYRFFLGTFLSKVSNQIGKDIKERDYPASVKLGDFENLKADNLRNLVIDAYNQTKEAIGTAPDDVEVKFDDLTAMTPEQFADYIFNLGETLAK